MVPERLMHPAIGQVMGCPQPSTARAVQARGLVESADGVETVLHWMVSGQHPCQ